MWDILMLDFLAPGQMNRQAGKSMACMLARTRSIGREKSEKIVKNKNKKNAAAYAAEQRLFFDSFLKLKIRGL
jgi:hypothetical protein